MVGSHLQWAKHCTSKIPVDSIDTINGEQVVLEAPWVTLRWVATQLPEVSRDDDFLVDGRSQGELMACASLPTHAVSPLFLGLVIEHEELSFRPVTDIMIYRSTVEAFKVVVVLNEEGPVFFVNDTVVSDKLGGPLRASITPRSIVFNLTPWISDLNEFGAVSNLNCLQ